MSLRQVLVDWINAGLEPDETEFLKPEEQREFCGDVYSEDPDLFYDAVIEPLVRIPQVRADLLRAFRHGDFMQIGAVLDRQLRDQLIGTEYIEGRLREVAEQESWYRGDE